MMKTQSFRAVLVCFGYLALAGATPANAQANLRDVLRDRIDLLVTSHEMTIGGEPIAAVMVVDELYALRTYKPAWEDQELVRQLFDQVLDSANHGLDPEDFHARQLGLRLNPGAGADDPVFRADTEILCTDALVRLAVTLQYGKLDASGLDPIWNFDRHIVRQEPLVYLNSILEAKTVGRELAELGPRDPLYAQFQSGLRTYRSIMASGGWQPVEEGPILKVGSTGPRVEQLRHRLRVTGDLETTDPFNPREFDADLETAVRGFQVRHGIDDDGKAGPRTIEELNIPVEVRFDQLRASLERLRWVYRDMEDDVIIVDIAGFRAHLYRKGEEIWQTRVQVGKPFHATPVFKDTMRYLDFNPTWTIPPGILRKETLPAIRRDPNYLKRNNMSVVTTSGKVVDPSVVDWSGTGGFPYMIRQEPGPHNALGRVKFMFPNKYMVYLHDTPSKGLFARSERAFSHGCIRTQNPFELAELLLSDQGWDRRRIDQVLKSKKTTRVNLDEPITVMLLYWTAEVDDDGTVFFRKDIYDRDRELIEGLNEPYRISLPAGAEDAVGLRTR